MNGICDRTSNNKYFNCPPRMADGRQFTDYRPNSYVNDLVRYSNNVMSSYNYRLFLTNNAEKLMQINNEYIYEKSKCVPCNATPIGFNTQCSVNKDYSTCYVDDCNGLGLRNSVKIAKPEIYDPSLQASYNEFGFSPSPPRQNQYVPYSQLKGTCNN